MNTANSEFERHNFEKAGPNVVGSTLAWLNWQTQRQGGGARSFARLAPTTDLAADLILTLLSSGILIPIAETPLSAPVFETLGLATPQLYMLSPALGDEASVRELCSNSLNEYLRTQSTQEEIVQMWQTLAMSESRAYIAAELEMFHLNSGWVGATQSVLERSLNELSVAQTFSLSRRSVRDVACEYLRSPEMRATLPQTLCRFLERRLASAILSPAKLRYSRRHPRCPESALAQVFRAFTQLGERYLCTVPDLRNLRTECH